MPKYPKWVLTLGLVAAAPGVTLAGPFDFLKSSPPAARKPALRTPAAARPDNQRVAENIADVLKRASLNGHDIEITFQGGVATITGRIRDASQKARATGLVSKVSGVERVDNQLIVAGSAAESLVVNPFTEPTIAPASAAHTPPAASNDLEFAEAPSLFTQPIPQAPPANAAPADAAPSNQQTAEQIGKALEKARLSGYDIRIGFRNGTVRLEGAVKDEKQRALAEKTAAAVPGVEQVENRLIVPDEAQAKWMAAQMAAQQQQQQHPGQPPIHPVAYQPLPPNGDVAPPGPLPPGGIAPPVPGAPGAGMIYGHPGAGSAHSIYNMPYMPEYAWPATAQYPNSAGVQYPTQYSASAWPYIGPFYPYPQVPLGWRQAQLEWDDGHWYLNFRPRTDRWWWFLHPKNW